MPRVQRKNNTGKKAIGATGTGFIAFVNGIRLGCWHAKCVIARCMTTMCEGLWLPTSSAVLT